MPASSALTASRPSPCQTRAPPPPSASDLRRSMRTFARRSEPGTQHGGSLAIARACSRLLLGAIAAAAIRARAARVRARFALLSFQQASSSARAIAPCSAAGAWSARARGGSAADCFPYPSPTPRTQRRTFRPRSALRAHPPTPEPHPITPRPLGAGSSLCMQGISELDR